MGKEKKQFPLDNKENCCIYLNRIISSCELCMDKLKKYNDQAKNILDQYNGSDTVPIELYEEMCDKTYNVIDYLLNLLGDCQSSSISYFKYRQQLQKRINKGKHDIPLYEMGEEAAEIMSEFNRERNWQNHVPESLLIAEMEMVHEGKMTLPMDPVQITHYKDVTFEYFEHLYLSNREFYKRARQVIQLAKRDYSLLMGKTITYPRVYIDVPLSVEKFEPTKRSAKVQGLKTE